MDPFTAVGAGISTLGQIYTNQQNLQFAQQQASGAFVGPYVAAEKAAGINPYQASAGPSAYFHADNPLGDFARLRGITPEYGSDPLDKQLKAEQIRGQRLFNDHNALALAKLKMRGPSSPEGTVRAASDAAFGYPPGKDPPFPYNLVGPGMSAVLGGIDEGAGFIQRHLPSSVTDWLSSHGMD